MTTHTPRSIIIARWTAAAQVVIAGILAALTAAFTVAGYVADRAAARSGHPNEWAGAGEILGVVLTGTCLLVCILLALPAARLRTGRPLPRIALILAEAATCAPLAALLTSRITRNFSGLLFAVFVGLGVATVIALFRPPARVWADGEQTAPRPGGFRPRTG